ncbi:hypothetical protein Goarm_014369, partial [Gossypium armourianum]|nr:hypothetical protein [Gossypium armourianum]
MVYVPQSLKLPEATSTSEEETLGIKPLKLQMLTIKFESSQMSNNEVIFEFYVKLRGITNKAFTLDDEHF